LSTQEVALCMGPVNVQYPELLGLDGENLAAQPWFSLFTEGGSARQNLRNNPSRDQVWVVGSEDVAPINLAAAIKKDGAPHVALVSPQLSGSLVSRAKAAGIDELLDKNSFIKRYNSYKARWTSAEPAYFKTGSELVVERKTQTQPLTPVPQVKQELQQSEIHLPGADPEKELPVAIEVKDAATHKQEQRAVATQVSKNLDAQIKTMAQTRSQPATQRGRAGQVFSIIGAAGGVGKSTLCAVLASLAQARGLSTIVLDFDLQCGDLHYLLGIDEPHRVNDYTSAPEKLAQLKTKDSKPALLASPKHLEDSEDIVMSAKALIEQAQHLFDAVFINTAPGWTDVHFDTIESATQVLFVLDQRPVALRLTKHALELCARCGLPTQNFVFVLNGCSRGSLFNSLDVSCSLASGKTLEVMQGGREVSELLGAGQAQDLLRSRNALVTSAQKLLDYLLPQTFEGQTKPESKRSSLFGMRRKKAACL